MDNTVIRYSSELNDLKQDCSGQLFHLYSCLKLSLFNGWSDIERSGVSFLTATMAMIAFGTNGGVTVGTYGWHSIALHLKCDSQRPIDALIIEDILDKDTRRLL
jgi:hypothetical protein